MVKQTRLSISDASFLLHPLFCHASNSLISLMNTIWPQLLWSRHCSLGRIVLHCCRGCFSILNNPKEGIKIRIDTYEYRQWKARQNRKNLRKRTRRKRIKQEKCAAIIRRNRLIHQIRIPFHAPEIFSFTENPDGTTKFFGELTEFITNRNNFEKSLFIDISHIRVLTIDALMYLLAIVSNLNKNFKSKYAFSGNYPQDPKVRALMKASGFHQFVHSNDSEQIVRDVNNLQIVSGDRVSTEYAKRICDFVIEKGNVSRKSCTFLYKIIIELMGNVFNHAYGGGKGILYSRWYCFSEFDVETGRFSFTFMVTGDGIPSTVRKHGLEYIDFLNFRGDSLYVCSALRGELRSKTKEAFHGKGLPYIYETCSDKKIQNMRIITDQADVTIHEGEFDALNRENSLQGTLFYWQIDLQRLIEVDCK